MGGTYKKELRNEKAKVKLKGVKLPKGSNVTKTDFKVRKITIKEQLKKLKCIGGQTQINLKDVVSGLKHRNIRCRLDALRSLREAIKNNHPEIQSQLHVVIQSVSAISLDIDKESRRECFKTLSALLNNFSVKVTEPFFHIMSSYLCCGMSHIQSNIREDSLLMLDVALEHIPMLVVTHSEKIFENFLQMISETRSDGSGVERNLSILMNHQQTATKWRYKVLQRLNQMLRTLVKYNRKINLTFEDLLSTKTFTFNKNKQQFYSILRDHSEQPVCDISTILWFPTDYSSIIVPKYDFVTYQTYVKQLMPLLLETWLEVRPTETSSEVMLSQEAALTLKVILEIIEDLWALIKIYDINLNTNISKWFAREYAELFTLNFMLPSFPFNQTTIFEPNLKNKHKSSSDEVEQFCIQQNLCIAHLLCLFYMGNTSKQAIKFDACLNYMNVVISNLDEIVPHENFASIENVLRTYLLQNGNDLLRSNKYELLKLLNGTIEAFVSNKFSKDGAAANVLVLLGNIVSTNALFESYHSEEFETMFKYLPQLFLKASIEESVLKTMTILAKQKNVVLIKSLTKLLIPIIENIQHIKIVGALNAFDGKQQIMNLFYWIDKSELLLQSDKLIYTIEQHITDKRIVGHFKYILGLR